MHCEKNQIFRNSLYIICNQHCRSKHRLPGGIFRCKLTQMRNILRANGRLYIFYQDCQANSSSSIHISMLYINMRRKRPGREICRVFWKLPISPSIAPWSPGGKFSQTDLPRSAAPPVPSPPEAPGPAPVPRLSPSMFPIAGPGSPAPSPPLPG